jgi:membrane protein DedA with SNARE-associated domain
MEIISSLLSFILLYKYTALFIIFFLASAGIPFPTITLMIAGAIFAGQGYFDIRYTALAMWLGSVMGDCTLFVVARSLNKKLFALRIFKPHAARLANNFFTAEFSRHPYLIIIASRFFGFSTIAVNCLGGFVRFPLISYALIDAGGEALVTIVYLALGYMIHGNLMWFSPFFEQGSAVLLSILLLLLAWRWRKQIVQKLSRLRDKKL